MERYLPRIADKQLRELLLSMPAILIEGPRFAGKTETARRAAGSELLLDIDEDAKLAARVDPTTLLSGSTPRLLDEWQTVPHIWNYVRRSCDERHLAGQFILTGSAHPTDEITRHSGAGRIARLHLRPMSLFEQNISDGSASLHKLLHQLVFDKQRPTSSFDSIVEAVCRGGWPALTDLDLGSCLTYNKTYLEETSRTDLVAEVSFDPVRLRKLLVSLARNIATDVSLTTLQRDVNSTIQTRTIANYLNRLQSIHVVELQKPYSTHLRSKAQLRLTPKLHFCDPSLAVAALRANPAKLKDNLNYFGFLFESLVCRDLKTYAEANDATVYFYRDNTGLEIDAVIETFAGSWIPIEVKLGGAELIEVAAKNLKRLHNKVDTKVVGEPAAMLVITATPTYPYVRPDGVTVLSISSLGP